MWRCQPGAYLWESEKLNLTLDPARGLIDVSTAGLRLPQIFGVEIVAAADLGVRPLFEANNPPEVVTRQDTICVAYRTTPTRPVECDVRWRLGDAVFDLEVSTLTPGKWDGLSVQTYSRLPAGSVEAIPEQPFMILHRPENTSLSYVEMCHPHDGIGVDVDANAVRFRLFGHDLEKGVILRGRLRGIVLPRKDDMAAAKRAYEKFIREPPHLSVG